MLSYVVPVVLKKPIVVLKDNRDNKGQQCHAVCISESYQLIFCILLKNNLVEDDTAPIQKIGTSRKAKTDEVRC